MTQTAMPGTVWWRTRAAITWAVIAAALLAVLVVARVQAVREENVRVDELYCTLGGIGPFDRGPKTGRSCADLLTD